MKDISSFKLDVLREDVRKVYKRKSNPTLTAFKDICFDIFKDKLNKTFPNIHFQEEFYIQEFKIHSLYGLFGDGSILVWCKEDRDEKKARLILNDIEKQLKDNLELENKIQDLNELWENKNLRYFYYCSSIAMSTKENFEAIQNRIKKLVNTNLAKIYGLEHLKQVETKPFTWKEIQSLLVRDKYIYHKWIGISKTGIYDHIPPIEEAFGYRKYLLENHLPYISREEFLKANPDKVQAFYDESKILENLLYGYKCGYLIYGDAGTGKTRLLFELGYQATKKNWITLRITDELNDIYELELDNHVNYVLLFDNVEKLKFFDSEIFYRLRYYNPGANFRFIATCKTSYSRQIHIENMLSLNVSKHVEVENEYKNFVIEKVLSTMELKEIQPDYFQSKLSFVVYVLHLKKINSFKNNLNDFKTFSDWLIDRLASCFGKKSIDLIDRKVVYLLVSFPLSSVDIYGKFRDTLKALVKENWIEKRKLAAGEKLEVVHESLIDVVLEFFLRENMFFLNEEIKEIMIFAKENKAAANVFLSFERIIESDLFQPLPIFYNFWFEQFWEDSTSFQVLKSAIYERYVLVYKYVDLLLGGFLKEDRVYKLFIAWLSQFKEKDLLKGYLKKWLKENPLEIETGFVFYYWLLISKDAKTFQDECLYWLSEYFVELQTGLVLGEYLKHTDDPLEVVENVLDWLEKYPLAFETSSVLEAWLNATGNKDVVRVYIIPWTKKYNLEKKAGLLIAAWLNAGADLAQIKEYFIQWIKSYPLIKETGKMIHGWIYAEGELTFIQEYMVKWLEKFSLEDVSGTLIGLWLKFGGDKDIVQEYIKPWLVKHSYDKKSVMPVIFWLDAGGKKEMIEEFIIPWMQKNAKEEEAWHLVKAWRDAGGNNDVIKNYIRLWLQQFSKS
ncbi:MAG: ATP-binding protein [Leptospiraceae bacterium]|nr:ATP-binding protein [Leptospiraceae bacterium]